MPLVSNINDISCNTSATLSCHTIDLMDISYLSYTSKLHMCVCMYITSFVYKTTLFTHKMFYHRACVHSIDCQNVLSFITAGTILINPELIYLLHCKYK